MKIHPRKQYLIDTYGHDPLTLDELGECTVALLNAELRRPNKYYNHNGDGKVIGFQWEITHSEKVSNSHWAPLDGFTNWGGDDKRANGVRGYPGWQGRVWVRYSTRASLGSEPFQATLTHPGTGGYGGYDGPWEKIMRNVYKTFGHKRPDGVRLPSTQMYSWDYRFFDSDFPGVKEVDERTKAMLWKILKEEQIPEFRHKYFWEDQATAKFDKEFLAEYEKRT